MVQNSNDAVAEPLPPLTHKGWFGLCPVYFGGLDTDGPLIVERHPLFMPLMVLSEWLFALGFIVLTTISPEYEPQWPVRITGEIRAQAAPAE